MKNPSGICMCGCGRETPVSATTRRGYKCGEPLMYIRGHSSRSTSADYEERDCGYDSPCWVWLKSVSRAGYGRATIGSRGIGAHRLYYLRHVGLIPDGLVLDHLCRNPRCVNPAHLEPVTNAENGRRGLRAKLTAADALRIRASRTANGELARLFSVHIQTIRDIKAGRRWAA